MLPAVSRGRSAVRLGVGDEIVPEATRHPLQPTAFRFVCRALGICCGGSAFVCARTSFCDEDQTENIRATSGSSESASRFGTRPREKAHSTTKRGSPLPCGPKRRSVFRGSETALLGRNQASWTYSAEGSVVVAQLAGSREDVVEYTAAALLALVLLCWVEARVDGAAVHDAGRAGLAVDRNFAILLAEVVA